ncbi:hypothetical protein COF64_22780 [Bacillus sp. AFS043905]|nr:hypothetical protein COF64_22780 [Bacillus sp. AFS043905]
MDEKRLEKKIVTEMLDYLWRNAGYSKEKAVYNIAHLLVYKYMNEKKILNSGKSYEELLHYIDPSLVQFINSELEYLGDSSIRVDLKPEHALHIIRLIEDINLYLGDTFNYSKIFTMLVNLSGLDKQTFLPSPIIKIIVQLLVNQRLSYNADIGVANCGSGQFLSETINTLKATLSDDYHFSIVNRNNTNVFGFDFSQENIMLTKLQLLFNDSFANLEQTNFLLLNKEHKFELLFITPPFGVKYREGEIGDIKYNIGSNINSEVAYLFKTIECLKVNGWGVIHLPEGFFYNQVYKNVRKQLLQDIVIEGIISLPSGITKSNQNKTNILIFRKLNHSYNNDFERKIWFYEINKGDLEYIDSETFILNNSQDLINSWNTRDVDFKEWQRHLSNNEKLSYYPLSHRTNQKVTFASYRDIRDKQYNLSLSSYKFVELQLEEEKQDLKNLLSELIELEEEILSQIHGLMNRSENSTITKSTSLLENNWTTIQSNGGKTDPGIDDNTIRDTDRDANKGLTEKEDRFTAIINQKLLEERELLINKKMEEVQNNMSWFIEQLADWQRMLLYRYYDPRIEHPLAIHEAAKGIVGVQEAVQATNLFKSMGLLEKVVYTDISQSHTGSDSPLFTIHQGKPVSIERWQPAIEFMGERKDEIE